MARILFLAHRIPYPPNKGDKIRSWHFLEYLMERHEIHLGFFIDDPADLEHVDFLQKRSASLHFSFASPLKQKLFSLKGFLTGTSLTENAYPSSGMRSFVANLIDTNQVDAVFLYSAATYRFLPKNMKGVPIITDFVDVDSAKWEAYAANNSWPMSLIFRREGAKLAAFEAHVADRSLASVLVSKDEAALMRNRLSNRQQNAGKILGITNGVNAKAFSPEKYSTTSTKGRLIFTGAMDYAPNIEAVVWFVENVFHRVKLEHPHVELVIAGKPVAPDVQRLDAHDGVNVIGAVDDMAETIAGASIVIAPLLTARGIQNKVLEGMAMAKPVIATRAANEGINAPDRAAIWIANDPDGFAEAVAALLEPTAAKQLGVAARNFVMDNFSWSKSCRAIEALLIDASDHATQPRQGGRIDL